MTQPKLTASVQRGCAEVMQNNYTEISVGMITAILQAALKDPSDPDWLARQLFVLHDSTIAPLRSPEAALRVWNANSDDAEIKVCYRMVADGLRMLITGQPV